MHIDDVDETFKQHEYFQRQTLTCNIIFFCYLITTLSKKYIFQHNHQQQVV